jgi:hypothetical protein
MAEPPSDVEPVKLKDACPLPGTTRRLDGAPGTVTGVTELEAVEADPVPAALVAVTVNV